jgi:hypothetical protein
MIITTRDGEAQARQLSRLPGHSEGVNRRGHVVRRKRALGAVGVVCGLLSLGFAWGLAPDSVEEPGPELAQYLGVGLGALMLFLGAYYLIKGDGPWPWRLRPWRKKKRSRSTRREFP